VIGLNKDLVVVKRKKCIFELIFYNNYFYKYKIKLIYYFLLRITFQKVYCSFVLFTDAAHLLRDSYFYGIFYALLQAAER